MGGLRGFLLAILGGVNKSKFLELSESLQASEKSLAEEKNKRLDLLERSVKSGESVAALSKEAADAKLELREQWERVQLAVFVRAALVPKRVQEMTLSYAAHLRRDINDLVGIAASEAFRTRPSVGAFYWSLAKACAAASEKARDYASEDAVSTELVDRLIAEIELRPKSAGISVGVNKIFNNRLPLLKEKLVGADILLLLTGHSLVPNGGARLFWIQGKNSPAHEPWEMNIYRTAKPGEPTQLDALRVVNRPGSGSLSLYASYSQDRAFLLAMQVGELNHVNSNAAKDCKIRFDGALRASRMQELVTALAVAPRSAVGAFESSKEVLAFLDSKTSGAIIPLQVVTVQAGESMLEPGLAQSIAAEYRRRIEMYRDDLNASQSRNENQNEGRSPDLPGPR